MRTVAAIQVLLLCLSCPTTCLLLLFNRASGCMTSRVIGTEDKKEKQASECERGVGESVFLCLLSLLERKKCLSPRLETLRPQHLQNECDVACL